MFEDEDLDLDFGEAIVDNMAMIQSKPAYNPKISSSISNSLHSPYQPYPSRPSKVINDSKQRPVNDNTFSIYDQIDGEDSSTSARIQVSSPNIDLSPVTCSNDPTNTAGSPLVRKFPGPAGIMPKLTPGDHNPVKEHQESVEINDLNTDNQNVLSDDLRHCVIWKQALSGLNKIEMDTLVEKFNCKWIKDKSKSRTSSKKMPFFMCKIVKLDLDHLDPIVVLADTYGRVEGSMHRDVVEQFGKDVRLGSVLVLQGVAVLMTARTEYVNITLNNLLSIYSNSTVKHLKTASKRDLMNVATDLDKVRQKQMESILEPVNQSIASTPQNLPPAWTTPQTIRPPPSLSNIALSIRSTPQNLPPAWSTPQAVRPPPSSSNIQTPSVISTISKAPVPFTSMPFKPQTSQLSANPRFTFKHNLAPKPVAPKPSQTTSEAAYSQQLVNSLLSDLDTSDIWSDF